MDQTFSTIRGYGPLNGPASVYITWIWTAGWTSLRHCYVDTGRWMGWSNSRARESFNTDDCGMERGERATNENENFIAAIIGGRS